MHKIKDLCVVTRTYSKNGQEKKVWKNVGGVYVNDEGHERIAIDAFFNFSALRQDNSDRVWLSAFTPKNRDALNNSNYDYGSFDTNATIQEDETPF